MRNHRYNSFEQAEAVLKWKIRTEAYTDPKVGKLSRTRKHQYSVMMKYIEVKN